MPGSANEAGMHAEYIKLCGHESARRHQNLERPLRELSARRRWIGTTAQLPCSSPKITPHGAPENVGEDVSSKSFDRDDGWEARHRLPMILTRFSSFDRNPL